VNAIVADGSGEAARMRLGRRQNQSGDPVGSSLDGCVDALKGSDELMVPRFAARNALRRRVSSADQRTNRGFSRAELPRARRTVVQDDKYIAPTGSIQITNRRK
jgi:hypothetical protein